MGDRLKSIGMHIARYGLAIVLLWIGGMMFTAYQAEGIRPLVANSPLMSWVYRVMSVGGFSSLLGVVEIAIGVLIALRPVWPMGSAVGSGLAAGMFLTTLSFLVTTPGGSRAWAGSRPCPPCLGSPCSRTSSCWEWRCRRPARRWRQCAGVAPSWRPPLKVQFTTTRDEGKLTGVYGTGSAIGRAGTGARRLGGLRDVFDDTATSVNDNLPPQRLPYHGQYPTEWRHCVCYFHENQEAPS